MRSSKGGKIGRKKKTSLSSIKTHCQFIYLGDTRYYGLRVRPTSWVKSKTVKGEKKKDRSHVTLVTFFGILSLTSGRRV